MRYTELARQLRIWAASKSSSPPTQMAMMEKMQAICWRPIMQNWEEGGHEGWELVSEEREI